MFRTLLSILADFISAVVKMFLILLSVSNSFSLFSMLIKTVRRDLTTIGHTILFYPFIFINLLTFAVVI